MNEHNLKLWLDTMTLDEGQTLIAGMAISLAKSFDESGNTSTAAELRKTILELKRMVDGERVEFDPLEKLLTRNE